MSAPQYVKPVDTAPTRHLFVGNCGSRCGWTTDDALSLLKQYGVVQHYFEGVAYLCVSYESEAEATAAIHGLAGYKKEHDSKPLTLKYAATQKHKEVRPSMPVATTAEEANIPGLRLIKNFITEEEEQVLLASLDAQQWHHLAKRKVQHYGYKFEYSTRNVDAAHKVGPLPDFVQHISARIQALPDTPQIDQLTVNDYQPGVGLAPHIDTHSAFTGAIISLSLSSPCVMELRQGDDHRPLLLPPRSLLIIGGESRYAWQHYIPHRKSDDVNGSIISRSRRVSLTFREVRREPCNCAYPQFCDSQQGAQPPTRLALLQAGVDPSKVQEQQQEASSAPGAAAQHLLQVGLGPSRQQEQQPAQQEVSSEPDAALRRLEEEHVHKVYDAIASHFSATRFAIWPKVRAFIEAIPSGALVADVGCGNGKYFGVRRDLAVVGSDRSTGLAAVAAQRLHPLGLPAMQIPKADVLVADGLVLPYRSGSFDAVLCIAVLHHMSSVARRVRLLSEIAAVLRPGGRALVTVWATEQEDPRKTLNKWHRIAKPSEALAGAAGLEVLSSSAAGASSSKEDAAGMADASEHPGGAAGQQDGLDFFVPWHIPFHRAEAFKAVQASKAQTQERDATSVPAVKVDSGKGAVVLQRYYHLFEEQELRDLVAQVNGVRLIESFYDHSNWCVVYEKV